MLSLCSGMEQIRAEGGNPRTGCSHRTRPLRYATNYTHCGTSTLLACSRDSECTYPRRPCICTRSVRRASACAQTAVGQSDRRQLRVVTAARSVLRAVLHMPCTPAARCLGGGVAASHALRSAVTMLRRNTTMLRCNTARLQRNTTRLQGSAHHVARR